MIRVFIGFDPREAVAFHVLGHSIHRHATEPVSITPLMLSQLASSFSRERDPKQSTDFAFSRFMIPSLCDYSGWAIFLDCDMLCFADFAKLWALRDDRYAVMCVKHEYEVAKDIKFLGQVQTKYEKKNWSSVMLFNCAKCKALTPEYVNSATGLQLHQFKWLESEELIGSIPKGWNHLVGYYPKTPDVQVVHYTDGGPYFHEYATCDYGAEWFLERDLMMHAEQRH